MIEIQNKFFDESLMRIKFACNVNICKGACCTLAGGAGAPLLDEELHYIESSFPIVKPLLPKEHIDEVERRGLFEGNSGNYSTMCYNNRACVFVFYEEGIAKCSFEKAFLEKKSAWQKPVSCHLFPIRVDRGIAYKLRYERIDECNPALDNGKLDNIYLYEFLKEPLMRTFGHSWYNDFKIMCEWENNNPHSA